MMKEKKGLWRYFIKTAAVFSSAVILAVSVLAGSPAAVYADGPAQATVAGSDEQIPIDCTPIYNVNDLYKVNVDPKGKYILMNDIDLSETNGGSLDAGKGWVPLAKFAGEFDGNGHCIRNMSIHGVIPYNDKDYIQYQGICIGLFGHIEYGAVIKNLSITDADIDVASDYANIGILAGHNGGQINNCFVTGRVNVKNTIEASNNFVHVGGVFGHHSGNIRNCYSNADVCATGEGAEARTGGIMGFFDPGFVENCYAIGEVKGTGSSGMICGLIYRYSSDTPQNCYYLTSGGTDLYGRSLTSAQMKMTGAFPTFDFYKTWILDASSPYPYPQLRNCMQVHPISIRLSSLPLKQLYHVDERLDLTGAGLDVVYEDGTTANIPVSEYMVSCNMSVGSQTAVISYGNCTDTFGITIEKFNPNLQVVPEYTKETGDIFYLDIKTESDGDISYSSQNSGVADVDASGRVRTFREGTVDIIVSQKETRYYKAESKTVKIIIGDHDYQTVFIPATAKVNGSITETCSKCGAAKTKKTIYAIRTASLSKTSYAYNGKVQKPSVTVKDSKGKTLKNNTDYTVSDLAGTKNVGRYAVTVTFKGNYSGTVKKTFDITPKGTSISKLSAGKKGFSVRWKKQTVQTMGYEISYSTSSRFSSKDTKIRNAGNSRSSSKTVSGLKAGKKYYVRIRTYKTVKINGKSVKLYSEWSKAKTVTTKK